jgi:hypothetical protein
LTEGPLDRCVSPSEGAHDWQRKRLVRFTTNPPVRPSWLLESHSESGDPVRGQPRRQPPQGRRCPAPPGGQPRPLPTAKDGGVQHPPKGARCDAQPTREDGRCHRSPSPPRRRREGRLVLPTSDRVMRGPDNRRPGSLRRHGQQGTCPPFAAGSGSHGVRPPWGPQRRGRSPRGSRPCLRTATALRCREVVPSQPRVVLATIGSSGGQGVRATASKAEPSRRLLSFDKKLSRELSCVDSSTYLHSTLFGPGIWIATKVSPSLLGERLETLPRKPPSGGWKLLLWPWPTTTRDSARLTAVNRLLHGAALYKHRLPGSTYVGPPDLRRPPPGDGPTSGPV